MVVLVDVGVSGASNETAHPSDVCCLIRILMRSNITKYAPITWVEVCIMLPPLQLVQFWQRKVHFQCVPKLKAISVLVRHPINFVSLLIYVAGAMVVNVGPEYGVGTS